MWCDFWTFAFMAFRLDSFLVLWFALTLWTALVFTDKRTETCFQVGLVWFYQAKAIHGLDWSSSFNLWPFSADPLYIIKTGTGLSLALQTGFRHIIYYFCPRRLETAIGLCLLACPSLDLFHRLGGRSHNTLRLNQNICRQKHMGKLL